MRAGFQAASHKSQGAEWRLATYLEKTKDELKREEDRHGAHVEHVVHGSAREGALEVVACVAVYVVVRRPKVGRGWKGG